MDNAVFESLIVEKIKNSFEKSPEKWRINLEYGSYPIRDDGLELRVTETDASIKKPIEYKFSKDSCSVLYDLFKDFINSSLRKKEEDTMKSLSLLFQIDRGSKIKKINKRIKD